MVRSAQHVDSSVGGGGSSGMGLFEEAQTRRLAAWPFLA